MGNFASKNTQLNVTSYGAAEFRQRYGTGSTSKNRTVVALGTTKSEVTWQDGDNITEISITPVWSSGVTTSGAQYCLACLDVVNTGVAALIGADASTAIPASAGSNLNAYLIPVNTTLVIQLSEPLSYDGTTYVGNCWVRAIDNTNTLDVFIGAN